MILKFVIRNLIKRPFLNFVKIIGLSLALSGILLIVIFLKNELSFDNFHKDSKNIYRFSITNKQFFGEKHFARVYNNSFIPEMAEYFPEIENYIRLSPFRGGFIKYKEKFIKVNQAFECDSTFFNIFDAELVVGNPENVLNDPSSMVISESYAKKTFGNINPIGQILTLPKGQYYNENIDFTIKGVFKDFPQNSHFHPDFITTPKNIDIFNGWAWTYLLLHDKADPGKIESGFNDFYSSLIEEDNEVEIEAHLQNITDIHLYSHKLREIEANSNISVIYTLSIAALILLFIALTNYANLTIGMASYSDKYLFISKVSGSSAWINLKYFFYEGIIIAFLSIVISGFIVGYANIVILKYFAINIFDGNIPLMLLIVLLFSLLGMMFSILPLLKQVISHVKSSLDYRNGNSFSKKGINKSLIVFQYTISIVLIVAVIVIQRQTNLALRSSMGVDVNNLICIENVHSDVQAKFEVFKEELLKYKSVESVSAMFEPPGGEANDRFQFSMEGYIPDETKEGDNRIGIFPCEYSFASIFNLKFLGGSSFSDKNEDNEGSGEYIINKSAMHRLNYKNADDIIGKEFALIFHTDAIKIPKGRIIGVVDDFHLSSIKKKVEPLVMFKRKDMWLINFVISIQPEMQTQAFVDIEKVWTKIYPEYPFKYEYVSSMYKNVYETELLQSRLLSIFTFIALFICSMGLLGLSLLITQGRTKEIGIRKVNGAKINEIMRMLNWDIIKWILISFVFAIPLAFYSMNKWLENFAYKTALSWWIFALAGLVALFVSFLTISLNSWRAARRNPVEALRYE